MITEPIHRDEVVPKHSPLVRALIRGCVAAAVIDGALSIVLVGWNIAQRLVDHRHETRSS